MNHITKIVHHLAQGASDILIENTALNVWGMSPRKFRRDLRKAKNRFARRACHMDILAELMISIDQQSIQLCDMIKRDKDEDQNAYWHDTIRKLQVGRQKALMNLYDLRDRLGCNFFKTHEDKKAIVEEQDRKSVVHFSSCTAETKTGVHFDPQVYGVRPGMELSHELLAQRDFARMRMLPKSPREDMIFQEILDTLTQPLDNFDPNKYPGGEYPTDIGMLDPYEYSDFHGFKYAIKNKQQWLHGQRIYLERLRHYNETWCEAEKLITGVMDTFGIKLHVMHQSVGIPEPINRALNGDLEAIKDLKEAVALFRIGKFQLRRCNDPHPMPPRTLNLDDTMIPLYKVEQTAREFYEKRDAAQKEALAKHGYIPDELLVHPQFNVDVTRTRYDRHEQIDTTLPKMPWDKVDGDVSDALSPRPFRPGAGDGGGDESVTERPPPPEERSSSSPLSPPGRGAGGEGDPLTAQPIMNDTAMSQATSASFPPTDVEALRDPAPGLKSRGLNALLALLIGFTLFWNILVLTVGANNVAHAMKVDAASCRVVNDSWLCNEALEHDGAVVIGEMNHENDNQQCFMEDGEPLHHTQPFNLEEGNPGNNTPPSPSPMRQDAASTLTPKAASTPFSAVFRGLLRLIANTS